MFVDTHCHLFFPEFENDITEVIKKANDAGVEFILVPGTDLETSEKAIALAEKFDCVFAAVGFHPHDAKKAEGDTLRKIENLSFHEKVVAIGEIGLDYHYDFSPRDKQKEVFTEQIKIAQRRNLPIIIHERESSEDIISIVEHALPSFEKNYKGVFHCFSGDTQTARKVIDWGFYISIPGPVTFPEKPNKPNTMADVASRIAFDHILLETDAPFLTPVPFRGKRNEPAHIPLIAKKIAELQHHSLEDVGRATSFGAHQLFGIGAYPSPEIVYKIRNSLYVNITLRCDSDCVFCNRRGEAVILGHNLKVEREPTVDEILSQMQDPAKYDEIVFCGYGEPTIRLDAIKEISKFVKSHGGKVRLNTDGHGNIINHRNIVPEFVGLVDAVSISLNSADKKQYTQLMRVNDSYFHGMIHFAKECVAHRLNTTMTTVDLESVDAEKAQLFVEQEIGATFRRRNYF
ncbi:MAG: YchF/TatD family DNA exonuclease [Ignavibacteriales bacterium]|nr:YchF/TatD family DNA exonuclease [Ignavibacteriales bacterium]